MTGGDAADVPLGLGLSLFDRAALALLSACPPQAPELQWAVLVRLSAWNNTHKDMYSHDVDIKLGPVVPAFPFDL